MRPLVHLTWHVMCPLVLVTWYIMGVECDKMKKKTMKGEQYSGTDSINNYTHIQCYGGWGWFWECLCDSWLPIMKHQVNLIMSLQIQISQCIKRGRDLTPPCRFRDNPKPQIIKVKIPSLLFSLGRDIHGYKVPYKYINKFLLVFHLRFTQDNKTGTINS
jgi:hypothetical protein